MEQIGVVVNINDSMAKVQFKRASACGENCGMCGGCEKLNSFVDAKNVVGAEAGDTVKLETNTAYVLLGAFFVYIVPIIIAIATYYLYGIVCAAFAFVLPFVILKILNKKLDKYLRPNVVKILKKHT